MLPPPNIPEPSGITPDEPDRDTKKGLLDFTNPDGADGRIFYMNMKLFHYGTNDKTHAASIFLSILLAFVIVIVLIIGAIISITGATDRLLSGLLSAFTLTIGIAVGKSGSGSKDD